MSEIDLFGKPQLIDKPPSSKRVNAIRRAVPPVPESNWRLPSEFPDLSGAAAIAIDLETHDPDVQTRGPGPMRDGYILGVAVGTPEGMRQYYPIGHKTGPNCDRNKVLAWLRRELGRKGQPKIGAHIIYDLEFLAYADVYPEGPFYDVQNAEPLLDEHKFSYSLETLANEYLGESKVTNELKRWLETGWSGGWKGNIFRAPPELVGPYAEGDVDLPLRIFEIQKKRLIEQKLWDTFILETNLIPILLAMRRRGVRVDMARAEQVDKQLHDGYEGKLKELKDMVGFHVEISAPGSVAKAFDLLGLHYNRTEKTDQPSFTKDFLANHPHIFPKTLMQAREFDKLRGTFIKGHIMRDNVRGRVYSQFHQLRSDEGGTISGRFSSSLPNLQNIPSRHEIYGPLIRSIFIPEEGHKWFKFDWSQIEYRLIVHYSVLRELAGAADVARRYREDPSTDFHKVIAELTGLPRPQAKNINFGIAYGQGLTLLCSILGVSQDEGRAILNEHARMAPFIKKLSYQAQDRATQRGFITTMLGRRARFPFWEDKNSRSGILYREFAPGRQRAKTYKALNSLIQGTAADIMKKAMVDLWDSGICAELGAPHLTVHDELDGSFLPDQMKLLDGIKEIMENAVKLHVPMTAELATADNWGYAK